MTASLLATAAVGAIAQTFIDVDETNTFFDEIENVNAEGILTGFDLGDGTFEFRPGQDLPRRAAAAAIYRLAGEPEGDWAEFADERFTDRDGTGQFDDAIGWAVQAGIISGFDEGDGTFTFRAGQDVSRAAWAVWLYGLQGSPADQDYAQVAADAFVDRFGTGQFDAAVGWASANGIITGYELEDGSFEYRGSDTIKRRAVAAMASRYFEEFGKGFVEGRIDATFTVLRQSDAAEDGDGSLLLSTGESLTIFEYDVDRDDFFIDGVAASPAAVLEVADEVLGTSRLVIEVNGSATDGYQHNFTVSEEVAGVVGLDADGDAFVITDFPSGITVISNEGETWGIDGDADLYVVDGSNVTATAFENNVSTGDLIEVTEANGVVTLSLTNNAPTGIPADATTEAPAAVVVDVLGDEDFEASLDFDANSDLDVIPGHVFYDVAGESLAEEDFLVTLNGEDTDIAGFDEFADVVVGLLADDPVFGEDDGGDPIPVTVEDLEATYDRSGGEVTIDVTGEIEEVPEPEFAPFEGTVIAGEPADGDGDSTEVTVVDEDGSEITVTYADTRTFRVDGLVTTLGSYSDALSFGDTLACEAGTLDDDNPDPTEVTCSDIWLTNVEEISGEVFEEAGDIRFEINDEFSVDLFANAVPFGIELADDEDIDTFLINGESEFLVNPDEPEGDVVEVDLDFVVAALSAVAYDVVTVTGTLTHDDGEDGVWAFDGLNPNAIQAAIEAATPPAEGE